MFKGHVNTGLARWAMATMLTLATCLGVILAMAVWGVKRLGIINIILTLIEDMILAAIPAVGFAMVFNVPLRALKYCALLGAIGHGSRTVLMISGMNIEWAKLLCRYSSRLYRYSMVTLVVSSSKSFHCCSDYSYVSWDQCLCCDDLRGEVDSNRL